MNAVESPSTSEAPNGEDCLIPPENYSIVCPGIYRSGFPKKENFPFVQQLGLKSMLTLVLEEYPIDNLKFLNENNIILYQCGVAGNKEPFVEIPEPVICRALSIVLDSRNHPILIHCNRGKHRTGCLVGILRRFQRWALTCIFDEYQRFSYPKERMFDEQFIELFDLKNVTLKRKNLPEWFMLRQDDQFKLVDCEDDNDNNDSKDAIYIQ